jgi:hypothetical protein
MNQELTLQQKKAALEKLGIELPAGASDAMLKADQDAIDKKNQDMAARKQYAIDQMRSSGIAA